MSLSATSIRTAISSSVLAVSPLATGASLTHSTVISTAAGSPAALASLALNSKPSRPQQSCFGRVGEVSITVDLHFAEVGVGVHSKREAITEAGKSFVFYPDLVDDSGAVYPSDPATWSVRVDSPDVDASIDQQTGNVRISSNSAGSYEVTLTVPSPFGDQTVTISVTVLPGAPSALN